MTTSTSQPRRFARPAALLAALISSVMVLSGCSIYDVPLPGGVDTGDNPMRIKVMFRDVLDLVPQSTVKIDDVTVGKVKSVKLKGYVAQVSIEVRKDLDLPDNARAEIRQTSLLGEKFVSLSKPQDPSSGKLANNDVIGLDRTGRNPEVEEVLGALSLLLNGGGVGQLKTIASELNNALGGRETEVRSVLDQIRSFMGQLDQNKESIVTAIENTNRLAVQLRKQDGTIKSALDNVPDTLRSVNRQRDDLVKLLQALSRLSGVGVRVIKASKESTINSLRDLAPVLDKLAAAGQNLPKAFQVFLTYPFVDEAVGRDPQVARNLHMGDYTNLSVNLDLSVDLLGGLTGPVCDTLDTVLNQTRAAVNTAVNQVMNSIPANPLITTAERKKLRKKLRDDILGKTLTAAKNQCRAPDVAALVSTLSDLVPNLLDVLDILTPAQIKKLLADLGGAIGGLPGGSVPGGSVPGGSVPGGSVPGGSVPGGGVPGVGVVPGSPRVVPGAAFSTPQQIDPFGLAEHGYDPGIGTMLLQGVAEVR